MQTTTAEPVEPSEQFCPNSTCCGIRPDNDARDKLDDLYPAVNNNLD